MMDILLSKLAGAKNRDQKFNLAREYLQVLVLKILSDRGRFAGMAFIGGTALRILFGVRRFSEDLDFSVTNLAQYSFEGCIEAIERELRLLNLPAELRSKRGVVDSCMLNFTSVLQEAGIAIARDQKLSIKIEVDTHPPDGASIEESVVSGDFLFPVVNYDLPSLMAGKLHAVLFRKFTKGRDFYDLLWYLSRRSLPNVAFLENAIFQTESERLSLKEGRWIHLLNEKLGEVDFAKVIRDVQPFIQDPSELQMMRLETFQGLLEKYHSDLV